LKTVTVGLVGLGYWGPNLARNFSRVNGGELVYLCDLDEARLREQARLYPQATATTNLDELLADSSLDAVAIATSAPTHYELARRALDAGKHVFVEKPLALAVSEAREIVEKAEARGLVLMVGHLLLYHPAIERVKTMVDSGEIGDILYLYSQRLNLGRLRKDENVVWSLAPHDVSVILHLLDEEPAGVQCSGADYLRDGVEDVAFITVKFASGRMAHVHVSWLDPHKTRKLTIVGSRKMVVFDDMQSSEKIFVFDKGVTAAPDQATYGEELTLRFGDIVIPYLKMQEPLLRECQHFVDCVRDGTKPRSDGRNGLDVLKVLHACDVSLARGGEPVAVADIE